MTLALIDGDEIAYKVASRYQKKFYGVYRDDKLLWHHPTKEDAIESIGNELDLELVPFIEVYEPKGYEQRIKDFLDNILFNTNSSDYFICLSGSKNFRYSLATLQPYKGNRDKDSKPGHFLLVKDYLTKLGGEWVDYLEADDLMTIKSQEIKNSVICSTDKDLRTVPSKNYNISTGVLQEISPEQSLYNFYFQLLIGDSTDNIPYPYGLGEVTAHKILSGVDEEKTEENYYQTILPAYFSQLQKKDKEGNFKTKWYKEQPLEEILWEVGNLLWMHRTLDPEERWKPPFITLEGDVNG